MVDVSEINLCDVHVCFEVNMSFGVIAADILMMFVAYEVQRKIYVGFCKWECASLKDLQVLALAVSDRTQSVWQVQFVSHFWYHSGLSDLPETLIYTHTLHTL